MCLAGLGFRVCVSSVQDCDVFGILGVFRV